MPNPTDKDELRKAVLEFDKSRGQTGADYVIGKITRQQADSEFEDDISKLLTLFDHYTDQRVKEARIDERNQVALDNYRGQTFSDSTNYKGKFDKFIGNNERRIATLKESKDE